MTETDVGCCGGLEDRLEDCGCGEGCETNPERLLLVPYSNDQGCCYKVMVFQPGEVHELLEHTNYLPAPDGAVLGDYIEKPY